MLNVDWLRTSSGTEKSSNFDPHYKLLSYDSKKLGGGGGEGGVSPLFVVQLPPNLAWQFSEIKSLKGSDSKNHTDVTMKSMTSLCSVEYRKLLKTVHIILQKTVYLKIGAASSYFIWSYSNLAETLNTNTAVDWKSWIWINRCFSCSDDVINIMLAFLTNTGSCFSYLSKILLFWHRLWKSKL